MKVKLQLLFLCFAILIVIAMTFFMYALFYPLKYQDYILTASLTYNVKPEVIASVINAESSFNSEAVSSKGAVGLMQVMPSTAEYLAQQLNLSTYDLFEPEINIMLGSYYLSYLIDQFGDLKIAVCAYNAGPNRVRKWLNEQNISDKNINEFNIPYAETRNYLKKVLKNINFYQNCFN